MKKSTIIGIVIAVIIVGAGAWIVIANNNKKDDTPAVTTTPAPTDTSQSTGSSDSSSSADTTTPATVTVNYTDSGFETSTITAKSGGTITFVNKSSDTIQVDSDPHPQHTDNTELNVGQIAPGSSKSITVTRTGSFGIHNHLDDSMRATVVVQ